MKSQYDLDYINKRFNHKAIQTDDNMLVPMPCCCDIKTYSKKLKGYEWLQEIQHKNVYIGLNLRWPGSDIEFGNESRLPIGYDYYILSFHLESVDIEWLELQRDFVEGKIIVLFDGTTNNYSIPDVWFLPFYYWHIQTQTMIDWFGVKNVFNRTPKYKISNICNRLTSQKAIVFTAIAENYELKDTMLALHNWHEHENKAFTKNIFDEKMYLPKKLKELHNLFFEKYNNKIFKIDDYTNNLNFHKHTANPWQDVYQDCAIHVSNESFNSSDIFDSGAFAHPGPFITEKTLKCLLGATAFIPIGQYDIYGALTRLGFKFDYEFDTSFDNIVQDNDRLVKSIDTIIDIEKYTAEELYNSTIESSLHNHDHIVSGDFYKRCENINKHTIARIINYINS